MVRAIATVLGIGWSINIDPMTIDPGSLQRHRAGGRLDAQRDFNGAGGRASTQSRRLSAAA